VPIVERHEICFPGPLDPGKCRHRGNASFHSRYQLPAQDAHCNPIAYLLTHAVLFHHRKLHFGLFAMSYGPSLPTPGNYPGLGLPVAWQPHPRHMIFLFPTGLLRYFVSEILPVREVAMMHISKQIQEKPCSVPSTQN
jgi:hypothetical protein